MSTKKSGLVLLMISASRLVLVSAIFAWIMLKPIQVTYRDSLEMDIGSTKTIIVRIDKSGTIFRFNDVSFSFGLLQDGKPKALPENLVVKETGSSPLLPPFGKNQIAYMEISVSGNVTPGKYFVYLQPRILGISLGKLPVTIIIKEPGNTSDSPAADDLIYTPAGIYEYRANITGIDNGQGPDGKPWPPIKEKTVLLPFYREK
jgi:hypothetical protein